MSHSNTALIPRQVYAKTFGPTVGDKLRLGDTGLVLEVEKDYAVYGDECKFGGGKVCLRSQEKDKQTDRQTCNPTKGKQFLQSGRSSAVKKTSLDFRIFLGATRRNGSGFRRQQYSSYRRTICTGHGYHKRAGSRRRSRNRQVRHRDQGTVEQRGRS